MSVKVEANGRRSVAVEFELPGTPEEVWAAIATGPGITSWFVTTKIEQQDGQPAVLNYNFGPEMNISANITAFEPPRLFAAEQQEAWGDAPKMATEWLVQAKSGSVCSVRVVHSLFASTDDWDDQLQEAMNGWAGFLVNLRLYMTHFRGQIGALLRVKTVVAATTEAQAWQQLTAAMGAQGLKVGQHWAAPEGAPPISGVVEHFTEDPYDALFILDKPLPGIGGLGANIYPDGSCVVAMHLYLYGDKAEETVAYGTPLWQKWFDDKFGAPVAVPAA